MSRTSLASLFAALALVACKSDTHEGPSAKAETASSGAPKTPAEPPEPGSKADPTPRDPTKPEPSDAPGLPGGVFAFERVDTLEQREFEGGRYWVLERSVAIGEQDERLLDAYDGVNESLDASHAHIFAPLSLGQELLLVTHAGQRKAPISGFGLGRTMDDDVLSVILGQADTEGSLGGLVIGGTVMPAASAKLRASAGKPPTPGLLAALQYDYELAKAKVLENFEPLSGNEERPRAEGLALSADCVLRHSDLSMPEPYIGVVSVQCGGEEVYEARISGLFLLDAAGTPKQISKYDGWQLGYGGSTLDALVDLDGDGYDELLISDAGYEYYAQRQLAWDGKDYVPFPAPKPKP